MNIQKKTLNFSEDYHKKLKISTIKNLSNFFKMFKKNFHLFLAGLFGVRTPARKDSTISFSEAPSIILKKRISKLTGLVSCQTTASCNALHQSNPKLPQKSSLAKSGTAINTICSSSGNLNYTTDEQSSAFTITGNGNMDHTMCITSSTEPRVVFQLPENRRPSICFANAVPTLRERVKGSPRFPHRIAPTSSLNALIDDKEIDDDNGLFFPVSNLFYFSLISI